MNSTPSLRDDAGAWEIRDFLKRSVVEFEWIELSTEEDCRRELDLSVLKNVNLPVVELPDGTRLFGPPLWDVADRLGFVVKPKLRQYDVSNTVRVRLACLRRCTLPRKA